MEFLCASTCTAMLTLYITHLTQHPTPCPHIHTYTRTHPSIYHPCSPTHRCHTHEIPTKSPCREVIQESIKWHTCTHSHTTQPPHESIHIYTHVRFHAPHLPLRARTYTHIRMYTHAHTCSPKRDSWSYQTKACESQLSSDGFEMWALPYHLPARCWE